MNKKSITKQYKKPIIGILILVLIIAIGILIGGEPEDDRGSENGQEDTVVYSGTVTEVDASEVPVDGPYRIHIQTKEGANRTILIPSMGINLCPVRENLVDTAELSEGDEVEARGVVTGEGQIEPCETEDGYLERVASDEISLGVGEIDTVGGVSIQLNEIVQESRCPVDAECIEAGAIVANVTMSYEGETETRNFPSDEVPYEFAGHSISIVDIQPPLYSGETISQDEYEITFRIE